MAKLYLTIKKAARHSPPRSLHLVGGNPQMGEDNHILNKKAGAFASSMLDSR